MPTRPSIEACEEGVLLRVRVQPRASRESITSDPGGPLRVTLTAPPAGGEANEALVRLLAKRLGVPKRSIELIAGAKSRDKTLRISGLTAAGAIEALTIPNP